MKAAPISDDHGMKSNLSNGTGLIGVQFDAIFEKILLLRDRFPNIHYLGIDRPARLRPGAHATGDCLHVITGTGVFEGWTHIWQYFSHEFQNDFGIVFIYYILRNGSRLQTIREGAVKVFFLPTFTRTRDFISKPRLAMLDFFPLLQDSLLLRRMTIHLLYSVF